MLAIVMEIRMPKAGIQEFFRAAPFVDVRVFRYGKSLTIELQVDNPLHGDDGSNECF